MDSINCWVITCTLLLAGTALGQGGSSFKVTSNDIRPGAKLKMAQVFKGFGCEGDNLSPELSWSHAPAGTKSFAVTAYDPDAPSGSGWWHWIIYNIPANVTHLDAGAGDPTKELAPPGSVQGRTDFGTPGYGGACPPKGSKPHRYIFTVYALKMEKLDVPDTATAAAVGFTMSSQTLGKATLTALYNR